MLNVLDKNPCTLKKTIQHVVRVLEHVTTARIQVLVLKQDIGLAVHGKERKLKWHKQT